MNENQAMTLIIIASVWKQISYNFLFFLAGLQSIPKSLIEAAVDRRCGPMAALLDIQLPLLSPTTFFLLVINIVYAFFDTFAHRRRDHQRRPRPSRPRSWSTRSTTTASRRWTWAARPRSR